MDAADDRAAAASRRRLIHIIAIVLGSGLLLAILFYRPKIAETPKTTLGGPISHIVVLVPNRRIASGERISGTEGFRELSWPKERLPERPIRTVDEVLGKVARRDLEKDEPLGAADLRDP